MVPGVHALHGGSESLRVPGPSVSWVRGRTQQTTSGGNQFTRSIV